MAGIFPSPTGVPANEAENSYEPANAPIGGPARFYGPSCETVLYAWALNAIVSELLAAVDRLGFAYNSSRVDNLGAALADIVDGIQTHLTTHDGALVALSDRVDDAETDIDNLQFNVGVIQSTLITHGNDITAIQAFLADLDDGDIALDPPIAGFTTLTGFLNAMVPMLGNMPSMTLKGNNTGATGPASDLTVAQVAAILPLATNFAQGLLPSLSNNARTYFDGLGGFSEPPLATLTDRGAVPALPNDATQVFRGDGSWGGSPGLDAGICGIFFRDTVPAGWLKANGAAVALATYPNLASIYCGNANNPSANWGFRCTNPANPTGTRDVAGAYIVLPDARGEFIRGWDDARGVDTGRVLWLTQLQAIQAHNHSVTDPGHVHAHIISLAAGGTTPPGPGNGSAGGTLGGMVQSNTTGISIQNTGGTETRPRNIAAMICIKY